MMNTTAVNMTRIRAEQYLMDLGFREWVQASQKGNYLHADGRQARITYDYDQAKKDGAARLADGYYVVEISNIRLSRAFVAATRVR